MIIYVDENVPQKITTRLRAEGHQVEYVTRRVEDKDILEIAYQQKALLITSDKDFERLVLDERRPTAEVILPHIATRIPIEHRAQIVVNMLRKYQEKLWGAFTHLQKQLLTYVVHCADSLLFEAGLLDIWKEIRRQV